MDETLGREQLALEHERLRIEAEMRRRELDLKSKEVEAVSGKGLRVTGAQATILVALVSLASAAIGAGISGYFQREVGSIEAEGDQSVEAIRAQSQIDLERLKFESSLVLKAIEQPDLDERIKSLRFFANAGFIPSHKDNILRLSEDRDAIPALGQQQPTRPSSFGRLFPELAPANMSQQSQIDLAQAMAAGSAQDKARDVVHRIDRPAGYPFLGMFINNDITHAAREGFALDLSVIYGNGPEEDPHLYRSDDPAKLLLTRASADSFELNRTSEGITLTGDPRNARFPVLSHIHVAFMRFHNSNVDRLRAEGQDASSLFREARQQVTWHYQWLVFNDYLRSITGSAPLDKVSGEGRRFYRFRSEPYVPLEFTLALAELDKSAMSSVYRLNDDVVWYVGSSGNEDSLHNVSIDWALFFAIEESDPQRSEKIDTAFAEHILDAESGEALGALPFLRKVLLRGSQFGLPAGQDVARAMGFEPGIIASNETLLPASTAETTPLYVYLLTEAETESGGSRLGEVGGTLLAEVYDGAIIGDHQSFRWERTDWRPFLGRIPGKFDIVDVLRLSGEI